MVNATGSIPQCHFEGASMLVRGKIYMDYQATTPLAEQAFTAMEPFYKELFGNPHSSDHSMGWEAHAAVEGARASVSSLIGASAEEIFFTSGATESNNQVFNSICQQSGSRSKILVSSIEHKSVLDTAHAVAELYGVEVILLPVDRFGLVEVSAYESLLDSSVLLVSVMAVNNEIGVIQDVSKLCKMAHGVGAIFHTDASQAPAAVKVSVTEWGVDFLSLSSHKIYGPKGIGALFANSAVKDMLLPFHHGGGQEEGKRSGTLSPALCVGFGSASKLLGEIGDEEKVRVKSLRELFIQLLVKRGVNFSVNGTVNSTHPGNISIIFFGVDASHLLARVSSFICASLGSACSSGYHSTSHVLNAIGLDQGAAESTVRFSIGRFTDALQIEAAADVICSAVSDILSE